MNWFRKHRFKIGVAVVAFNFLATILLLMPLLNVKKSVADDFIVQSDRQTGEYTQKKHLADRRIGILALILLIPGFSFQVFEILMGRSRAD